MRKIFLAIFVLATQLGFAQENTRGASESTPSRSQYFSWINNTNEGATQEHTLINLAFFKWLHEQYGMVLDIYAMDAGVLDGKRFYGSLNSERFKERFPGGFDIINTKAASMGTRLGVWGGPDGFGDTPESIKKRTDEIVSLARDYNWALLKFDAVCGPLRPEMEDEFIAMMKEVRKYSPDLILLNHRLGLKEAEKYATTFLWGGRETYIDVFTYNSTTAAHNRAGALERGLVPDLKRLTEDHGVCISSCIDYWQDDLILQGFNRNLILSPQIYGNPWLLRDDEYPLLARIYNLHRRNRDIMIDGLVLPEENYGKNAVSRGDSSTRIITLRNNSWNPKKYTISLDQEVGLTKQGEVEVRRFHPSERILGSYNYGDKIEITVEGFRSYLLAVSTSGIDEYGVEGLDYRVVSDLEGRDVEIDLLALPGTTQRLSLPEGIEAKRVLIDGVHYPRLAKGGSEIITFEGDLLKEDYHRKIIDLQRCDVPSDALALYEATIFAADNNALEVRSIERSGDTQIAQVEAARDAFFKQSTFINRGIWDKNLFDGDMNTGFWASDRYGVDQRVRGAGFRLDLGELVEVGKILLKVGTEHNLQPLLLAEGNYAYISENLRDWDRVTFLADTECVIEVNDSIRYLRVPTYPNAIFEVEVYGKNGEKLDSSGFRASNLFADSNSREAVASWSGSFKLNEVAQGSYLCIAINGEHGIEGAYAAAKIDGEYVGAPSRAVSYPSNTWEYINRKSDSNYTYYIPIDSESIGKEIEIYVLGYDKQKLDLKPEVWLWTDDTPYQKRRMIIQR